MTESLAKTATTLTIDQVEYDLNALPDAAKQQLLNVQLVNQRIVQLQQDLAYLQTARAAYVAALKSTVKV